MHGSGLVEHVAKRFGLTHEGARLHVKALVDDGTLVASGRTRAREYSLSSSDLFISSIDLSTNPEEHLIWQEIRAALPELRPNVVGIFEYAISEMLNNAIEHSGGTTLGVAVQRTAIDTTVFVMDDGVGIFEKVRSAFNLGSHADAVVELAKGKLTTDPARHTGEGVFFTSRSVDDFVVTSGDFFWSHEKDDQDWVLDRAGPYIGTTIQLRMLDRSTTSLAAVFARFAGPDHEFARTQVPVVMATALEEGLVSRSSARRLLARLERFDEVVLDFSRVKTIGQAFADEIFRVFKLQHPETKVTAIRAAAPVLAMIERARNGLGPSD